MSAILGMSQKKQINYWSVFGSLALILVVGASYTNVSTRVNLEDQQVFVELGLQRPNTSLTFEQEIELIREVQAKIFKIAPLGDGIPLRQTREPLDLMRFGQGLCYDRSRTFDKAFAYLGFESRHIYLLYKENKPFFDALIQFGQASHAVTEVKTRKGWLFIDSNSPWIALNRHGEPVDADDVWRRFDEFDNPPEYLHSPWWAIRGMYSRNGLLYPPYISMPEFNWMDLLGWLIEI